MEVLWICQIITIRTTYTYRSISAFKCCSSVLPFILDSNDFHGSTVFPVYTVCSLQITSRILFFYWIVTYPWHKTAYMLLKIYMKSKNTLNENQNQIAASLYVHKEFNILRKEKGGTLTVSWYLYKNSRLKKITKTTFKVCKKWLKK